MSVSQLPQQHFRQTNLERQTTWTAKVGPAYNPIDSTDYKTILYPNGIREYRHQAPAGGGWLSGLNDIPLPSGWSKGLIIHSAKVMFDNTISNWQDGSRIAVEFDNRIAYGPTAGDGTRPQANASNQINLSNGGMWQVDPATGHWADTGVRLNIAPLQWHTLAFETFVDFGAKKYGFNAVILDGYRYVPTIPHINLGMLNMKWAQGCNLQVQQCRQTAGIAALWMQEITIDFVPQ